MEVWFYLKEEPRLRSQHTRRRIRKNLYPRSSEARQESFLPLDKDLSWKSGSSIKKEPRLRGQHTRRRTRKNLHPRSSEARQESFLPLDKDLSWKSGNRTSPDPVLHFSD